MPRPDPFLIYRTTLFIALAAYYVVTTAGGVWRVVALLRGNDPRKRLLRTYLSYQLVSFRFRPLAGELLQIAFWCTILLVIYWLHGKL
jgi:hypothetical protein